MTRKDYETIAAAINKSLELASLQPDALIRCEHIEAVVKTADQLADYLKIKNDRFDRAKFLTACGID